MSPKGLNNLKRVYGDQEVDIFQVTALATFKVFFMQANQSRSITVVTLLVNPKGWVTEDG